MPENCVRPSLTSMPMAASFGKSYADPAFEPNNNFAFADETGLHESDALSALGSPSSSKSDLASHANNVGGRKSSSKAEHSFSVARQDQGNAFESSPAVRVETAKRSPLFAQHFGQITPPDDDMSTQELLDVNVTKMQESPRPAASVEGPAAQCPEFQSSKTGMSSRSERARNAANHRHSRSKPVKIESLSPGDEGSEPEEHEQTDRKREKYREKNRVAAAKCRAKKKMNSDHLEGSARDTERENTRLKLEERKLRDELTRLKEISLAHHPGGCKCANIHTYNTSQALRTAQGHTGAMNSFGMASPQSEFGGSVSSASSAVDRFGSTINQQSYHSSTTHPSGAYQYTEQSQFTPQQLDMMQMMMMEGDDAIFRLRVTVKPLPNICKIWKSRTLTSSDHDSMAMV